MKEDSGGGETLREGDAQPGQRAQDSDQSKPGKALGVEEVVSGSTLAQL